MKAIAVWLVGRSRSRLDMMIMFGLGYALGAQALGSWWARILVLLALTGAADMTAAAGRWLAGRRPGPDARTMPARNDRISPAKH